MIQNLYKHDVLSENSIVYWFEKGVAPHGRNNFRQQMAGFVNWLKVQSDEDGEEEGGEDEEE